MTEEKEKFLIENYCRFSVRDLAERLNVSVQTIRFNAEKFGLKRIGASERQIAYIKEHIEEIHKANFPHDVGLTAGQIKKVVSMIKNGLL